MNHIFLYLALVTFVDGRSLKEGTGASFESHFDAVLVGIISTAGIVIFIKLVAVCADFCRKKQFEESTNDETPAASVGLPHHYGSGEATDADFIMYPPVESTPDYVVHVPQVTFEPLPDISQLRPKALVKNVVQLRPKVSVAPPTEEADDFDDDVARHYDPGQDKIKLSNLIANNRHQIPREQVQYIKELGNGWFGKVLQGEGLRILPGHKKTKIVVQMLKEDAGTFEQLAFLQEGIPYRDIDHGNVMKLFGQCVDTTPYLNVLELCTFGDVKTYLRSHRVAMESFNEKGLLLKFAADIAAGLQAMHEHGYVHRDLAARNCLLSSDLTVKVGDYGVSEDVYKEDYMLDQSGDGIPVRWLAPECVISKPGENVQLCAVTLQCNIWSFGVVIWEILTFGNLPYADLSNEHVLRLVINEKSLRLPIPDVPMSHLDRLYQLMLLCWSETPSSRPNLRQLRIMLLHLLSNKINAHSGEFDKKWNQLMPRRQPELVQTVQQNGGAGHVMMPLEERPTGAVPYSKYEEPQRTRGFESNFSPQQIYSSSKNQFTMQETSTAGDIYSKAPTTLALENEESKTGASTQKILQPESLKTTVNELSLADELSGLTEDRSPAFTPVNSFSLADELNASEPEVEESERYGSVDSHAADDLVILNSFGDRIIPGERMNQDPHVQINYPLAVDQNTVVSPIAPIASQVDSNVTTPSNEFALTTSTPKKPALAEPSGNGLCVFHIDNQPSSFYHTALETQSSNPSQSSQDESSLSFLSRDSDEEEVFFGEKKFAAMLQTVVTSFDDDEGSWSFEHTGTSFEAIPEEDEESLAAESSDVFPLDTPSRKVQNSNNTTDQSTTDDNNDTSGSTAVDTSDKSNDQHLTSSNTEDRNSDVPVASVNTRVDGEKVTSQVEQVSPAEELKSAVEDIIFDSEDVASVNNPFSGAATSLIGTLNGTSKVNKKQAPFESVETRKFKNALSLDFTPQDFFSDDDLDQNSEDVHDELKSKGDGLEDLSK